MSENLRDDVPANISINLTVLQGKVFIQFQRLLDTLAISLVGVERVDDSAYAEFSPFFNILPAQNERLTRIAAIAEAQRWYLCTVFRDALELVHLFLDQGRLVCALFSKTVQGKIMGEDYNRIAGEEAQAFHSLGLPRKLEKLRVDFSVASDFEPYVLTINRVRNCLVHRLGIVTNQDVDANGELVIVWRRLTLVKQSPDGAQVTELDNPGEMIEAGWSVIARVTNRKKRFQKGERIELSYREVIDTVSTLMSFITTLAQSIEGYGKQAGIRMPEPPTEIA